MIKRYVRDFSSTTSFNDDKIMSPYEYLKELKRELKDDQVAHIQLFQSFQATFADGLKADQYALMRELKSGQADLKTDMDQLKSDQAALKADIKADQAALKADQTAQFDNQLRKIFWGVSAIGLAFSGGLAMLTYLGFGLKITHKFD